MARSSLTKRYEGRLFVRDGILHMVTEVDPEQGLARVSCRRDGQQLCLDIALDEIADHLGRGGRTALG